MELYIAAIAHSDNKKQLLRKLETEGIDIGYMDAKESDLQGAISQIVVVSWPSTPLEQAVVLDKLLHENGYDRLENSPLYHIRKPSQKNILIYCTCEVARNLFFHLWDLGEDYTPQRIAPFPAGGLSRYTFQNYQDGYTAPRCLYLNDSTHLYQSSLLIRESR